MASCVGEPSPAMNDLPNWLEMPHDLMGNILQRLGIVDILTSAWKVCTTWRTICNDAALWKVICLRQSRHPYNMNFDFEMLTKQAVDLSSGELIDITIIGFGSDDLLDYIVLHLNKLKRLHLLRYEDITGSGLSRAVKSAPQLEDLRLSNTSMNVRDIEAIGQNCPQLKSFMISKSFILDDDDAIAIANSMHELCHLDLFHTQITNIGLLAILCGCPHLEFLDV